MLDTSHTLNSFGTLLGENHRSVDTKTVVIYLGAH